MDFPTSGPVGTQVTVTGTGFPECRSPLTDRTCLQKGFRVSTCQARIRVLLNRNVHPRKRETGLTSCYSLASIEGTCIVKYKQ